MTAIREQAPRTPPRFVIRTFWMLHRAAYRISRGGFGLSRPVAGSKFGMLRLTSVGRRTGQPRVAIIGYYEDGPNLVTLAMNGWGDKEPAWWLNLQAQPDTTVELAGETRAVRARAATVEERDRLWATVRDYPGWGDDIDALAARRSTATAVVVFEPRSTADVTLGSGASAPAREDGAPTSRAVAVRRRRLARRHLWIIPGLALGVYANAVGGEHHLGLLPVLVFGIAPHLPVFLGIGSAHAPGQLAPRAVPLFNAMHQPALPVAILAFAAAGILTPFWFVAALAWLGHIVVDQGFDKGPRTSDGWRRPVWLMS